MSNLVELLHYYEQKWELLEGLPTFLAAGIFLNVDHQTLLHFGGIMSDLSGDNRILKYDVIKR